MRLAQFGVAEVVVVDQGVFQREPRRKRAAHAKYSRTHTLAKTGNFFSAIGAGSIPQNLCKGLLDGFAESCKAAAECSKIAEGGLAVGASLASGVSARDFLGCGPGRDEGSVGLV